MSVKVNFDKYFDDLTQKSYEAFLQRAIVRARTAYWDRRRVNFPKLKYVEKWCEELKGIRRVALDKFLDYVKMARDWMESRDIRTHWAKDAAEANKIIYELFSSWRAKKVFKVKSIASEEIGMNEYLEERGIKAWETDVGAVILQLMHGKAMHPTGVSIAVAREVAKEYLSKFLGKDLPADPAALTKATCDWVKKAVPEADAVFSGANAIVAETGEIWVLENEANGRLVLAQPKPYVCLAGIEKVYPTRYAALLYASIMPVYVTGAAAIDNITIIGGKSASNDIERVRVSPATGHEEIHVVFLDNGRTAMLKDPDFQVMLTCLKCGACLMDCPMWNTVAGYFGEHVYMGAFGIVWTAFTRSLEDAAPQAYTCVLCGRCKDMCPMGIDLPRLIKRLRQKLVEKGIVPQQLQVMSENILKYGSPYGLT
ncbi:MAG: LUD domain-containing protein [Candidatus Bathyarchaeota archaeon]